MQDAALRMCREYRHARLRFDKEYAIQLVGNLRRAGVRSDEYTFTVTTNNELARALYIALRDRSVEIPVDQELITQLQTTRLVERAPNMLKLDNPAGTHDDLPTVVAMVIATLNAKTDVGRGSITVPGQLSGRVERVLSDGTAKPSAPIRLRVRRAASTGVRGVPWIVISGSANDPSRVVPGTVWHDDRR